ncbi:unnamed protein product, partial [Cochlearia groenlandica]
LCTPHVARFLEKEHKQVVDCIVIRGTNQIEENLNIFVGDSDLANFPRAEIDFLLMFSVEVTDGNLVANFLMIM